MRVFVVALAIDNVENYCGINEQTDCYAIFLSRRYFLAAEPKGFCLSAVYFCVMVILQILNRGNSFCWTSAHLSSFSFADGPVENSLPFPPMQCSAESLQTAEVWSSSVYKVWQKFFDLQQQKRTFPWPQTLRSRLSLASYHSRTHGGNPSPFPWPSMPLPPHKLSFWQHSLLTKRVIPIFLDVKRKRKRHGRNINFIRTIRAILTLKFICLVKHSILFFEKFCNFYHIF